MQHWNSYWNNTKTLNSFAESYHQQGYSGDIALFWHDIFESFANNTAILDIATGNGGLAVLAQQYNTSYKLIATDAADINPLALFGVLDDCYNALQQIQFIGNMPTEHLAFSDGSFDLVISQFGFEYAPLTTALEQIHRVLKYNGQFIALVHSSRSFITQDCIAGITVLHQLLYENGLIEQLSLYAHICQSLSNIKEPTTHQLQQLTEHNKALLETFKQTQLRFTEENQQDWFNLIAKDLVELIMQSQSLTVAKVERIKQDLQYFLQRIKEQIASAWTEQQAEKVKELCLLNWNKVSLQPLQIQEGILCWILRLEK
ncbi:class I SAM-dependent methyltransferase [Rheinheimera sp. D18]|uniref:class I SAM-dependent methyltransferase n=1 Tax=Rheinheimera sp. D18 TaxID=2545632 RepID=UPI00104E2680|nr:class I SAM-dependent methyltransferase [Rheinheimera sp. D18]QBL10071.1 class I SAM-dependent methyltransferase [Rheinheimera sp. D18]